MFETRTIIPTSQIDKNGLLKISSAFDLMQDCSFFQLDREKVLTKYFNDNNVGMYLVSRQVDIYKLPKYGDEISIRTYVYECNNSYGFRNTVIYDENEEECLVCFAMGAFVDLISSNLVRIPDDVLNTFVFDKKIDMKYLPRKIKLYSGLYEEHKSFKVGKYSIDDNDHVNNARYIDMAIDFVDDSYKRLRIEYKTPAKLGDTIFPKTKRIDDNIILLILDNELGNPYAVLEFSYII